MFLPASCERIDAGHVGIKVNNTASEKGVSKTELVTGWQFYIPWVSQIYEWPTYVQHKEYDTIEVTMKGGTIFKAAPAINYSVISDSVSSIFEQFRRGLPDIEDGFLKTCMLESFRSTAGDFTPDSLLIKGTFSFEIGQYVPSYGGIVVHRWASISSLGVPSTAASLPVQNYIIMDLADLGLSTWGLDGIDVPNCESTWDGFTNTASIITAGAAVGTAAQLCDTSTSGGKSDWYLPSIDELSMIWQNRFLINLNVGVTSGFNSIAFNNYWSSMEFGASAAFSFNFYAGNSFATSKTNSLVVRAVRRVAIV
jgi:hypothetical protein